MKFIKNYILLKIVIFFKTIKFILNQLIMCIYNNTDHNL